MSDEIKNELVSPFESNPRYKEILDEIRELRKEGTTAISSLTSENKDIKLNKQIDPEVKEAQIAANKEKIAAAKIVRDQNKARIKELIAEANKLSAEEDKVYVAKVTEAENPKIAAAKAEYSEKAAEEHKLHAENIAKLKEENATKTAEIKEKFEAGVADINSRGLGDVELKEALKKARNTYNKYVKEARNDFKVSLNTENVRSKSRILELRTVRDEAIDASKTAKFDAYHQKYAYMGKVRDGGHSPMERLENIFKSYIFNFKISDFLIKNGLYIIIFIFLIYCVIASNGNLLTEANILGVLSQSSTKLFFSLGVAGLILLGGTDLSIGRMTGMAASFTCLFLGKAAYTSDLGFTIDATGWAVGGQIIVALMVAIGLCVLFSSIAGFFTAKFKMHPFITTLSTQLLIFGIMMVMWKSTPAFNMVIDTKKAITGDSSVNIIIFAAIAIMIMWFIWNKTKFGKNMYAVGGNQEAAAVSGISVFKTTLLVFVMAGVLYGIGGFLEGSRVGVANPNTGAGTELDAIAACVIGGISFSGGVGKIKGAVIGTLIFTCLTYFLTNLGYDSNTQFIFKGVIIMAAVCLDSLKYLKKK